MNNASCHIPLTLLSLNSNVSYDGHDDDDAYDLDELSCGFYANAEFYERITDSLISSGSYFTIRRSWQ